MFFSFSFEFLWLFTVFPISLSQTLCVSLQKAFIFASFFLQSSRKRYGLSLSHFIFSCFKCAFLDFVSVLLPLCFEKYHVHTRVCFILVSVLWLKVSVFYCKLVILLLFIWSLCSMLLVLWMCCFIHIMLLGILSHYLSFESLWCSLPTWF